jgi:hypothetical protein
MQPHQQQLTIVIENRTGVLAEISRLMAVHHINIIHINAGGQENCGVLHLGVEGEDFANALEVLRRAEYQVIPEEVLLVQVEDQPGGLAAIAVKLADAKVNVRSMRIVKRENGFCLCAIVPEPLEIARAILADKIVS